MTHTHTVNKSSTKL